MAVFSVVAPCSLVEVYRYFRGAYCLHHEGDSNSKAVSISKTPENLYNTTRRNNSEDSHLHTRRHENLKSHKVQFSHH
jgi:hypothetical protein